nr:PhzF family phenazine biosynthesis protein [Vibrio sonorensis]
MDIKAQVYDVFVGDKAKGNPCGVLELEDWLSDANLLSAARELNQPVTSFVVKSEGRFNIRWFSLDGEINLCGHGSLGAGAALISKYQLPAVTLCSAYGEVVVTNTLARFSLTLPSWKAIPRI